MSRIISYQLLIDWDNSGSFNFNESNYMLSANGNESMTPPGSSSFSSEPYSSEMTIVLLNTSSRFSALNTSGPLYTYLQNGGHYQKKIRLTVTIDATTYTIFRGFIKSAEESFLDERDSTKVTLVCRSSDDQLKLKGISTGHSITNQFYAEARDEGQIIAEILETSGLIDNVNYRSQDFANPTIDRGLFSIPYFWMDEESPIDDAASLAQACGGRFFFDTETGMYYYKNAFEYATGESATSQETLTLSNCSSFEYSVNDRELAESIIVSARPRYASEVKEIWRNDDVIKLLPYQSKQIIARLNQPLVEYRNTYYTVTSTAGLPISGVTNSVASYSQKLVMTITNTSAYSVFIRDFYATGRVLEPLYIIEYYRESNNSYWSGRKGKEVKINTNAYVQSWSQAKAIGDIAIERLGSFSPELSVGGYVGSKFLRIAQMVTVSVPSKLSTTFIITKQSWNLSSKGLTQSLEMYGAGAIYGLGISNYFVIGTHSQNSSKKYFY